MALASAILARTYEDAKGAYSQLEDREVVQRFLALDRELSLLKTLRALNAADRVVTDNRNAILIFSEAQKLEIKTYHDSTEALRELFELEKQVA